MLFITILALTLWATPAEDALVNRIEKLQLSNGLFLDRTSDESTVSAAATGMGSLALAHAADRGLRDREEIAKRIHNAFELTVGSNPLRNRGWLSHFTDTQGIPKRTSEVSTIDTALFYMGMLRAAYVLKDEAFSKTVKASLDKVDVEFVLRKKIFLHGFMWKSDDQTSKEEPVFIEHVWNDTSEGVILYKLFNIEFKYVVKRVDYPLFVYSYPLVFFHDDTYETLLKEALDHQIKEFGHSGVTATDGPAGYTIFDKDLISPLLLSAVGTKFPVALDTLKKFELDPSIASYYIPSKWMNKDDLTIDLASAYVLLVQWNGFQLKEMEVLEKSLAQQLNVN